MGGVSGRPNHLEEPGPSPRSRSGKGSQAAKTPRGRSDPQKGEGLPFRFVQEERVQDKCFLAKKGEGDDGCASIPPENGIPRRFERSPRGQMSDRGRGEDGGEAFTGSEKEK